MPARQLRSVDSTTLYVAAARLTARICDVLIAAIASWISASFEGIEGIGG